MPDYSSGKIYMVYPKVEDPDEGDVYYGSTTVTLARRMAVHRSKKNCSSKLLFDKYGVENCFIELVENYPCETKEQLYKKEGEYIRANKCINKNIAGRPKNEQMKEYYIENRDKLSEQRKEYRIENRDKISEQRKEYYIENRDKLLEQQKEYHIENREKIKEYKKPKANCPHCNKEMVKRCIPRHIRTIHRSIQPTEPE